MKFVALLSLVLVLLLVSLSAYLRLAHSGIGCPDWPACYGQIGSETVTTPAPLGPDDAYRKLVDDSGKALAWATPLHRFVASVLGLLIVFVWFIALKQKRHRLVTTALLALTVYLAMLGLRSGGLHDPAVVMGNLAGGFCMLGLLGWLVFSTGPRAVAPRRVGWAAAAACVALALQIVLGGLTSANFAALSCRTLPDCHGGWWPGPALAEAFDLTRRHEVTAGGQAVGGAERMAIHRAHRLGAAPTLLLSALAAILAFRADRALRGVSVLLFVFIVAEFGVGLASVISGVPIVLALSHNALAALSLLALIKLLALGTPGRRYNARLIQRPGPISAVESPGPYRSPSSPGQKP